MYSNQPVDVDPWEVQKRLEIAPLDDLQSNV
jgi:hypothetical protein